MTQTPATRTYTLRFPRKGLLHIDGFDPATTGGGNDMGSHISYAPESHCAVLTRRGHLMSYAEHTVEIRHADDPTVAPGRVRRSKQVTAWTSAREVLAAAHEYARVYHYDICSNCLAAAERASA
jgi:hypothetical protein